MVSSAAPARSSTAWPSFAIFAGASVWGLYWLPLRTMEAEGMAGAWAVGIFNLMPVPVLLGWIALRSGAAAGGRVALIVGLLSGCGMGLYAMGLVYSSVVRATMIFYLTPVWGTLIGMTWLAERVDWTRWAAIATGLAGLGLMLSGGEAASAPLNIGDAMALGSGVLWACAAAVIRSNPGQPVAAMTMYQFLCAGLTASLFALAVQGDAPPGAALIAATLPIATLGAVGFIMPSVLVIFWAQRRVFPGRAGLLMMSEALVAVISATLLLPDEVMAAVEWLGAALILSACLIEVLGARAARTAT